MMAAQHLGPLPEHPANGAALGGDHLDGPEGARTRLVGVGTEDVGQLLDQLAAQGDVEQLHAAADGQERQVPGQGQVHQIKLQVVAPPIGAAISGIGALTVADGVDIPPTDQDQSVEQGHHLLELRGPAGSTPGPVRFLRPRRVRFRRLPSGGRQQQRASAGGLDHVEIGAGHEGGIALPGPPRGGLAVGGDPDEGSRPGGPHAGQYSTRVSWAPIRCAPARTEGSGIDGTTRRQGRGDHRSGERHRSGGGLAVRRRRGSGGGGRRGRRSCRVGRGRHHRRPAAPPWR